MDGYVLGKKNSEVYSFYGQKYYKLLEEYAEILNITKETNLKNFFLLPQVGSLLISLNQNYTDESLSFLLRELSLFLKKKYTLLSDNKGKKILNTKIFLSDFDINPFAKYDAHPDHEMNSISSFGEKSQEEWLNIFSKAFSILKKVDGDTFNELNEYIYRIVPHGTSYGVHNSGSYSCCIGQIYIGYTIDSPQPEITLLEAIIHESSHNKLNLIMHFDKVIECTGEEKYYSAIRPDARPIRGVFLGYHAFVPTMYIMMKAYLGGFINNRDEWLDKITLYYIKTKFLQRVIKKHANLTKVGKEIDMELDYVIGLCDVLFKEISPGALHLQNAKKRQQNHFKEVNSKYIGLSY